MHWSLWLPVIIILVVEEPNTIRYKESFRRAQPQQVKPQKKFCFSHFYFSPLKSSKSDQYSRCIRKDLETQGVLNATTPFNFVRLDELSKLKWTFSDYEDQEQNQCSLCLPGCKKADADPAAICKTIEIAKKQIGQKPPVAVARPIIIIVIIVIWPDGGVDIYWWIFE